MRAEITQLIRIGYWVSTREPHWPDPHALVDATLDEDDRLDTADYLKRGWVARAYMGNSDCRICGITAGSLELTDGTYIWPEGLTHYVEEHFVRLPEIFTAHVMAMTEHYESLAVDDSWWLGQKS